VKKTLHEIEKHELFQELFPIKEETKDRIKQDMSKNGFDENQPVVLATWQDQEQPVCIDGYTRIRVADELGIDQIPVVIYSVDTEQEAFEIALKRQANRRSLSDAEILQCVGTMRTWYGDPPNGGLKYDVSEIAEKLCISKRKAERALRVAEKATAETKSQVKAGITSIHKAETTIKSSYTEPHLPNQKPKRPNRKGRIVEIDPDQWEKLSKIVETTAGEIEDLVYEALDLYLAEDDGNDEDDTESEEDGDRAEDEGSWEDRDEDDDDEDEVEAA